MKKSQIFLYSCLAFIVLIAMLSFLGVFDKEVDDLGRAELDGEVEFVGVVKEVDERVDHVKLVTGHLSLVTRDDDVDGDEEIEGRILVKTGLYPEYRYGDELEISCRLQKPKIIYDFSARGGPASGWDYGRYLGMKGIYSVCYNPKIKILSRNNGNPAYAGILRLKGKMKGVIEQGVPEPQAGIFKAMFLGDKRGVSDELRDKLNQVGVSHVIAISGLHITIISLILMSILIGFGLWRKQAFWVATVFLGLYIIMIGAPASAVRAGIMGFLVLLAMNLGRVNKSLNALFFVACLMLLVNPRILRSDIGFQLSFLAVLGIIYFSPWFEKLFKRVPEKFGLQQSLVMTMSAQIMTLPLIAYQFKRVSIVAPLVNILILPILPFVLIFGAVGTIAGLVAQSFGWASGLIQILFVPVWLLLKYLVKVVELFSKLSFAGVEIESVSFFVVVGIYLGIGGLIWKFRKR